MMDCRLREHRLLRGCEGVAGVWVIGCRSFRIVEKGTLPAIA